MSEYVPTTDQVRDRYADDRVGVGEWTRFDESVKRAVEEAYAEFDAWLANHDAEVAAKALEDMAEELMLSYDGGRRDVGAHSKSSASAAAQKWAMQRVRVRAAGYRKQVQS